VGIGHKRESAQVGIGRKRESAVSGNGLSENRSVFAVQIVDGMVEAGMTREEAMSRCRP
jgi:hypothetical protein